MDLSDFDMVPAATVDILHPTTGEVLPGVTLQIAGVDSEVFQQRQFALADARAKQQKKDITRKQLVQERLETLAICLVGWDGLELDGKAVPHTPENAMALLKRLPWLQDQVDAAIVNRALHLKNRETERTKAA